MQGNATKRRENVTLLTQYSQQAGSQYINNIIHVAVLAAKGSKSSELFASRHAADDFEPFAANNTT